MLTAVIPTLNRPDDLLKAIKSILTQTRFPDELVIVDQSLDEKSLITVKNLMKKYEDHIKLIYIHDPAISGLVNAKRVSLAHSSGDIICFLEDDMVYEPEYFEQIELGFIKHPAMIGCSGFITNQPNSSNIYRWLFAIFHRGIFKDPRMDLSYKYNGYNNIPIPSNMLSGGASAWRREVFDQIQFDVKNDFHMYEDIEFSTRVADLFNGRLFINPNARVAHYFSPIGRSFHGLRQRRKIRESFLYYKKRKNFDWATISYVWLLMGLLIEAFWEAFKIRSLDPIRGFFLGLTDGIRKKISY